MRFQRALPTIKVSAMVATATAQARNSISTSQVLLFMASSITGKSRFRHGAFTPVTWPAVLADGGWRLGVGKAEG